MISPRGELFTRYEGNPIITYKDRPCHSNAVFNSGVIKVDGLYLMMLRIEDLDRKQHFRMASSEDGNKWDISKDPITFEGDEELVASGSFFYDPRITYIEEDKKYYVNFAVHSDVHGVRGGMISTTDFKRFQWEGFQTQPDCRNCVLFPEKINGLYVRLDRPHANDGRNKQLWMSYSPDLKFWGQSKEVMRTRLHHWDDKYIGPGSVPIKTPKGWLHIYHGVYESCSTAIYRLGVCLFDLNDPSKLIGRCNGYALGPREDYERVGDVPNVVFTAGSVLEDDNTVTLFYGGADQVMCKATASLESLLEACEECNE